MLHSHEEIRVSSKIRILWKLVPNYMDLENMATFNNVEYNK